MEKKYPENYSENVVKIIEAFSFPNSTIEIIGSASYREAQFIGDYDIHQKVYTSKKNYLEELRKGLQNVVAEVAKVAYVGDIKCGAIEEWRILKTPFNKEKSLATLSELKLPMKEYIPIHILLTGKIDKIAMLSLKDLCKYHTVRWSVKDIERNKVVLKDGRTYTLEEGIVSSSFTKIDAIAEIEKFVEFSCIYDFYYKKKFLNDTHINIKRELEDAIIYYKHIGNTFKMYKRMMSLARLENKKKVIEKLTPILNSDLGRIYNIGSEIDALLYLLENTNAPLDTIRYEIDQFTDRLSNVYTLKDYLKNENYILELIKKALKTKRDGLIPILTKMSDKLNNILNKESMKGGYNGGGFYTRFKTRTINELTKYGLLDTEKGKEILRKALFFANQIRIPFRSIRNMPENPYYLPASELSFNRDEWASLNDWVDKQINDLEHYGTLPIQNPDGSVSIGYRHGSAKIGTEYTHVFPAITNQQLIQELIDELEEKANFEEDDDVYDGMLNVIDFLRAEGNITFFTPDIRNAMLQGFTYLNWLINAPNVGEGWNIGMAKLRSLVRSNSGSGIPERKVLQTMGKEAYETIPNANVDGFHLIFSTPTLKAYMRDNTIVIAIRGTSDKRDVLTDSLIPLNLVYTSDRYKSDLETLKTLQAQYPPSEYEYYGVGHSLGGVILDEFVNQGFLRMGVSYNSAIQPKFLNKELNVHRIYQKGDILYKTMGQFLKQKPEIREKKTPNALGMLLSHIGKIIPSIGKIGNVYDAIAEHRLSNFEGGRGERG